MERSDIRELTLKWKKDPHFAALNAGYVPRWGPAFLDACL
jgi:hypothetical protein